MNTDLFIEAAKKKHGNVFDYSKTNYINAKAKVTITCLKHGEFQQRANSHLLGYGCKRCALELVANNKLKRRVKCICIACGKQFAITNSESIKGSGKYCSKDCYQKSIKVKSIKCALCGIDFLPSRKNSKYCSLTCSSKANFKSSTADFIANAIRVHGRNYSYGLTNFLGMNRKVRVVCNKHGIFEQRAADHLLGRGCLKCAAALRGEANKKFEIICCRSCGKNFKLPPH